MLADRTGHQKRLTAIGYGLANGTRPLLYFVTFWQGALAIRFTERVGKGIRSSARDALLADSTTAGQTGKSFGLLRAADSLGAFSSMLVGLAVIYLAQGNGLLLKAGTFKALVAVATVPGVMAVVVVLFAARDVPAQTRTALDLARKDGLPAAFYLYVGVTCLFTLANSSDAFVILRSQDLGGSTLVVVALMAGFNLIYGVLARPLGVLSDRVGKRRVIAAGWLLYAAVYLGFALAHNLATVALLLVPYGVYYAATEGIGRALVADFVPPGPRGYAFGVFHGALGVSTLLASVIKGLLYSRVAPAAPFYLGAVLAVAAAAGLFAVRSPARASD